MPRQAREEVERAKSPHERRAVLLKHPPTVQAAIIAELRRPLREDTLALLSDKDVLSFLHTQSPDQVTDTLQAVNERRRKRLLDKLANDLRKKVEFLLRFDPRTAAGMMSLDYVQVERSATFSTVTRIVRKHERRTGRFPVVLVMERGALVGELRGSEFALATVKDSVGSRMVSITGLRYDADEQSTRQLLERNRHGKLAVLDDDDSVMGVIYADDVLRVMEGPPTQSLYSFAGVSGEESVHDSAYTKVKYRYKWLIINIFHAFLAAAVIGLFQDTIQAFVLLAVYMPIVAGMGGNAATQTLAVVVRGLALKDVSLERAGRLLVNEMLAGAMNGTITGVLVALVAALVNQNPLLGLVIGIAMVVNLFLAGFFGVIIPLLLSRLGKDPASSATIFITTATDVFGFFLFLGLAVLIL